VNGIKPEGYEYINLQSIVKVVEDNIPNGTITETKIADDSISTPKLQANSISSDKIIAGAITTEKIDTGAVNADKIAANSISAIHIQTDAVEADKIKAEAITAEKIATSAVTTDKLDANAVTADKIAAGAITTEKLAAGAVTANKIAAETITANEISAGAVTTEKIAAGAITAETVGTNEIITNTANIKTGIIQEAHVADASISEAKIKDAAITNAKIADAAIDNAKIASVDASKITTGYLDADRIQAGSITSDKLVVQPANALPEGTIAYWTDSLIDVVNGIVPEGYTEVNLAPSITLTPYNAPEGSVVGDLLAGNKIYAGKSIQVGNKVFIENTSSDKGQIRVNSGGVDVVKIGEASTPKYYETCEIYVDVFGGSGSPKPKVYASLDGVTWKEIGSTLNLNERMTKVGLFSLQKEGTTLYLKVKTIGSDGAEDGDIVLYVDGSLAYTFQYSVEVGVTEEQIFTYTLPSSPSDGISISGGLLETPQIVLSNTAGKILFTDSYWEITDGQVIFDYYTELTMNFTNKYFDDKIIFFDLDYYAEAIRGFGLRFDSGGNTIGEIFNNDDVVSIGKLNKKTRDGPYISLHSNCNVTISGYGLEIPRLSIVPPRPSPGMIYFNSTDKHFYGYNGSGWVRLD
jgi:hypothetical protein